MVVCFKLEDGCDVPEPALATSLNEFNAINDGTKNAQGLTIVASGETMVEDLAVRFRDEFV